MKFANVTSNSNPTVLIIIIAVAAVLFLSLLIIALIAYSRHKLKRRVYECDRRFQYLHALLIGQDAQYVKRLGIISRTNLLYVDTHTKFVKRFKEIRDQLDSYAQRKVNDLKDLYDEHKYKLAKEDLENVLKIVNNYENEVNSLNEDLLAVVKPEEDCRQSSLSLKESLRRIKQEYYSKQADLTLVNDSFVEIFKWIDSQFEIFEEYVESAQYDDANNVLPQIKVAADELSNSLSELPILCTLIASVIPDKLISLENAFEVMSRDHYPLHHLCVKQSIQEIKDEIKVLTTRIKQFDLNNVHTRLDDISLQIDEYFKLFEEEKTARIDFEEHNEEVYDTVETIEKSFIKLCNTIPEVTEIFIINESQRNKINLIQNEINKVGALKRSLDTFIHSATKQPYSLLVKKMNELDGASKSIINDIDDFNSYLASLKDSAEKAYDLVYNFYDKLVKAEQQVREINVENISRKYAPQFEELYELLNSIYSLLSVQPINIENVNELVTKVYDIGNVIFDDGQISQDYNMQVLAENTILYANRDRIHLSDINDLVKQAEQMFSQGDFEQAYTTAGDALKRVQGNDKK